MLSNNLIAATCAALQGCTGQSLVLPVAWGRFLMVLALSSGNFSIFNVNGGESQVSAVQVGARWCLVPRATASRNEPMRKL